MRRSSSFATRVLGAAAAIAVTVGLTASAQAADQWKKYGGACDKGAFKDPAKASLEDLKKCVRMWEAYKDVSKVKGAEKDRVVAAMKRLYVEGNETDAHVSKLGLQRLKVTDLPERASDTPTATVKAGDGGKAAAPDKPAREKCKVPPPDKKDIKAADKHWKKGLKHYGKKKYDQALAEFLKMVDIAPGYAKSHYNAAAMYAMTEDEANMVKHLRCLQDIGDDDAVSYLKKAKKDSDFDGFKRKSAAFKEITGYVRVKIGNGLGEYGEDNVDNLEMSLEELGYESEVVPAGPKEGYPVIWYQHHARLQAVIIKEVVRHPDTKLLPLAEGEHDIVILWDDKVKKGEEPRLYVPDPADAEKSLDEIARKQNEALRKPDEAMAKVDDVLDTPDRIQGKVEKITDAPGKAVDKIEKTGKKIEGILDKF